MKPYERTNMNETEMIEWNDKIERLIKHIKKEFPNGCSHIPGDECNECMLYNQEDCTLEDMMCDIIQITK